MKALVYTNLALTLLIGGYVAYNHKSNDIAGYLKENPEVIIASLQELEKKHMNQRTQDASAYISSHANELFNTATDARITKGEPKVKVVEFYDYACGYCHKMLPVKEKILAELNDIEIIFKEMPIMSPRSAMLATGSSAFYQVNPKGFFNFHKELYKTSAQNEDELAQLAAKHGADLAKFKQEYAKIKSNNTYFAATMEQARGLGLQGTPAYLINNELVPGYVTYEELKAKIDQAKNG